jgi:hypothetical protein
MDHAFPYLIQFVKEYQGKVDKLVAADRAEEEEGRRRHVVPRCA